MAVFAHGGLPPPAGRPSPRRGWVWTVGLGAVVALAAIAAGAWFARPPAHLDPVPTGRQGLPERLSGAEATSLPAASLPALRGPGRVRLADYRGAPLVVNFWATWCDPCVREMPVLQAVAADLRGRVSFLGVNVRDDPRRARALARRTGVTYDLAGDRAGRLFSRVDGYGMPTTLLVDPGGTIVYRHAGPLGATEVRALLRGHLGVRA